MQLHDRFHDRQPQPGPSLQPRAPRAHPVKPLEQARLVLFSNTRPLVFHRKPDFAAHALDAQFHRFAIRTVPNGIAQQVRQCPLKHQPITLRRPPALHTQLNPFQLGTERKQLDNPRRLVGQCHGLERDLGLGLADLGEKQHVIDDAVEPGQFFDAVFQHFPVIRVVPFAGQRHLRLAHQVAQRCAQFMGQIIGKLRQLADALIEAVEHHVDAAGQLCQLQRQAGSGKAMLQVLGRHPPGNAPEVPQWPQAALHQPPGTGPDQQQQQRQREQGGMQIGLQQGVVVGAVERHHHLDRGVVAQAHQPGRGEYLVAIAVAPRMKGQTGIGAQLAYL
ncbi:Uncharacterised protein [Pseudomonas putida]|nr:Uncharacterised protein [Pseudomonas putida]